MRCYRFTGVCLYAMFAALVLIRCNGGQKPAPVPESSPAATRLSALKSASLMDLRQELLSRRVFRSLGKNASDGSPLEKATSDRAFLKEYSNGEILADYRGRLLQGSILHLPDTTVVLYGVDTRIEINDVADPFVRAQALGVGALIPRQLLTPLKNGFFKLSTKGVYHNIYHLCTDLSESFLDQPVCADCSSFAVSTATVVTAGHCIHDDGDLERFYLVFDYRLENMADFLKKGIPDSLVYKVTDVIGSHRDQADYSVCRVNKPIGKHRFVGLDRSGSRNVGDGFYVIGFPGGLPMKYADEAVFRSGDDPRFVVVAANTYGGNSGSPLFSTTTRLVEGILVRGDSDFVPVVNRPCSTSKVCKITECRGEDAIRISNILPFLTPGLTVVDFGR